LCAHCYRHTSTSTCGMLGILGQTLSRTSRMLFVHTILCNVANVAQAWPVKCQGHSQKNMLKFALSSPTWRKTSHDTCHQIQWMWMWMKTWYILQSSQLRTANSRQANTLWFQVLVHEFIHRIHHFNRTVSGKGYKAFTQWVWLGRIRCSYISQKALCCKPKAPLQKMPVISVLLQRTGVDIVGPIIPVVLW